MAYGCTTLDSFMFVTELIVKSSMFNFFFFFLYAMTNYNNWSHTLLLTLLKFVVCVILISWSIAIRSVHFSHKSLNACDVEMMINVTSSYK